MDFAEVEQAYQKHLYLDEDPYIVRIIYSVMLANRYEGNPVWMIYIGAAGCGKSELLMSISQSHNVYAVSTMTPTALASGYGNGDDNSLLFKLGSKDFTKILVIKDLSATSRQKGESRDELMGLLRDAYDGKLIRITGRNSIDWEGKFGLIAGATPAIEYDHSVDSILGERFLHVRSKITDTDKILETELKSITHKKSMRKELRDIAADYIDNYATIGKKRLTVSTIETLKTAARALAKARSGVMRDGYSKEIQFPVEPAELPMRVFGQLILVALALETIGTDKRTIDKIVFRIIGDSIPYTRFRILQEMAKIRSSDEQDLAQSVKISIQTLSRSVEELEFLDIVKKVGGLWKINNPILEEAVMQK